MSSAVIYLRVSTEDQAEKGFSLQIQKEECTQKAKELNCVDIAEFSDEGVSGSILERPMLLNALAEAKAKKADYFICFDSSRLSRNVAHQLILIDHIKKIGAKLVFVRSSYEDTAEGRFQITIMAAVDEYERARIKIRTELGKRAKANQKQLTHNPNLYGYTFDNYTDTLKLEPTQAANVRLMYSLLIEEGLPVSEITKRLNQLEIPSMRKKQWNRVCVNRILRNYSYTGILYIRRYDTKDIKLNKFKKKEEKAKLKERPRDQWIGVEIPCIIEKQIWERAQEQLTQRKSEHESGSEEFLLSGLLRCGECGGAMFGKKVNKNNKRLRYYCCKNKYNYDIDKKNRCSSKLHRAEELEMNIWNFIKPNFIYKEIFNREYDGDNALLYKEDNKFELVNYASNTLLAKQYNSHSFIPVEKLIDFAEGMSLTQKNRVLKILLKEIRLTENTVQIQARLPITL